MTPEAVLMIIIGAVVAMSTWAIQRLVGKLDAARATIEAKNQTIAEQARQIDRLEVTAEFQAQLFEAFPRPREEQPPDRGPVQKGR